MVTLLWSLNGVSGGGFLEQCLVENFLVKIFIIDYEKRSLDLGVIYYRTCGNKATADSCFVLDKEKPRKHNWQLESSSHLLKREKDFKLLCSSSIFSQVRFVLRCPDSFSW